MPVRPSARGLAENPVARLESGEKPRWEPKRAAILEAVDLAQLLEHADTTQGRLSLHSLRHSYSSMLIAAGLNVVFVSRQLGHANANITLGTYAHLYAQADHAHTARAALQASYQTISERTPRPADADGSVETVVVTDGALERPGT